MFAKFTDRAAKILAQANQDAQRFHHQHVGTEHLLLALAKEDNGVAVTALRNLRVDPAALCAEAEPLAKSSSDEDLRSQLPQTAHAKEVVEHAWEEAHSNNNDIVGTGHLLLGLLRTRDGIAAQVLKNLGVKLEDTRQEVLRLQAAGVED